MCNLLYKLRELLGLCNHTYSDWYEQWVSYGDLGLGLPELKLCKKCNRCGKKKYAKYNRGLV